MIIISSYVYIFVILIKNLLNDSVLGLRQCVDKVFVVARKLFWCCKKICFFKVVLMGGAQVKEHATAPICFRCRLLVK